MKKKIIQIMPAPSRIFAHIQNEEKKTVQPVPVVGIALVEETYEDGAETHVEYLVHGDEEISLASDLWDVLTIAHPEDCIREYPLITREVPYPYTNEANSGS